MVSVHIPCLSRVTRVWLMLIEGAGQQPQRGRWPMLAHTGKFLLLLLAIWIWVFGLGFGLYGWDLCPVAKVKTLRLGFWSWGWDLGLEAATWALWPRLGPWGWDLGLEARIWVSRLGFRRIPNLTNMTEKKNTKNRTPKGNMWSAIPIVLLWLWIGMRGSRAAHRDPWA